MRSLYLTFFGETNAYKNSFVHAHEPGVFMLFPLFILALGSIFFGFLAKDFFMGLGTSAWGASLQAVAVGVFPTVFEAEFLATSIKHVPFFISLFGMGLALLVYHYFMEASYVSLQKSSIRTWYSFFNKKWLFDLIYNRVVVSGILYTGYVGTFKSIDRGFLEAFGSTGLRAFFSRLSANSSGLQSGYIYNYAASFVVAVITLLGMWIALSNELEIISLVATFVGSCVLVILFKKFIKGHDEKDNN